MATTLFIAEIISSFFEVFIITEVMTKLYSVKKPRIMFYIMFGLFLLLCVSGIFLLNYLIPVIGISTIWGFSLIYIFCVVELKGKFFYKVITLAIMFLLFITVDIVTAQVLSILFGVEGLSVIQEQELRIALIIISKFIFFILSRVFLFIKHKDINKYNKGYWWISVLIFIISILVMLSAGYVQKNLSYQEDDFFIILSTSALFVVNIAIYYLILKISSDNLVINKHNLINQQNDMIISHYKEMEASQVKLKRLYHDFNNHLSYIENLISDENYTTLNKYIITIKEESTFRAEFPKTGNTAIDTIMEFKLSSAIQKGIEVKIIGTAPQTVNISDFDMCCILTNIIDNSIESCELLHNSEERFIKCSISIFKQYLNIEIENPVSSYNKDFSTGKENKELHGIGLDSIKNAVDKNNGFSYFGVTNGIFLSKIMIRL